jgi:hypothetical protein
MSSIGKFGIVSASTSVFVAVAEEMVTKLQAESGPEAAELLGRARDLAAVFRRWAAQKPTDEQRAAVVGELLQLQRRVMEYLCPTR